MKILVTGGAGYVGSTVASACLDHGIEPVIVDNLRTGRAEFAAGRPFYRGDFADGALLDRVFREHPEIEATVHCAALTVVPESVGAPLAYWRGNVTATISLVEHLLRNECHRFLFSSTAAIYAATSAAARQGDVLAVDEESPIDPASPYARSKAAVEAMLRDVAVATPLRVLSLRYFNPIGADPQLRSGIPVRHSTFLLDRLIQATAPGGRFPLTGTDWPTRDGTGLRDFVHVWDLAAAHVTGLHRFDEIVPKDGSHYEVLNLGSGSGTTVREVVSAFEEVTGARLRVHETGRRPGDVAGVVASTGKAKRVLGWQPRRSLAEGIRDALRWAAVRDRHPPADRNPAPDPHAAPGPGG